MQTFLSSPQSVPNSRCANVRQEICMASSLPTEQFLEAAGTAIRRLFSFDYMIYLDAVSSASRRYIVWPPYNGTRDMFYTATREQDAIVINSYNDTLVRICGREDVDSIAVSVLKKYMREANDSDFSLMFLRKVIRGSFIGQFGFISFHKDAYGEGDAAALFEMLDAFQLYWDGLPVKARPCADEKKDLGYLSLINLPGMQGVLKQVYSVCREDFPVLLLGETGTGKEGVSRLIYQGSGRNGRAYLKINCGGIPLSLIESKLFGYVKGAFTGAVKDTPGCFELAHEGVLLLDEIGELPLGAQVDLLRVLQERVIERVGSSTEIPVNVRIIAATNRNLADMAEKKRFRSDLLYRLSVFPIYIPALRERPEDIPVLLNFFILQQSRRRGYIAPPRLLPSEIRRLCVYPWPGNIREMQNAVIRAMLLWDGRKESSFSIEVGKKLFEGMFAKKNSVEGPAAETSCAKADQPANSGSLRLEDAERAHIRRVLDMTDGRVTGKGGAAELMDINPSTLRARMKKLGIAR